MVDEQLPAVDHGKRQTFGAGSGRPDDYSLLGAFRLNEDLREKQLSSRCTDRSGMSCPALCREEKGYRVDWLLCRRDRS
jgi:hypothetical protein